MEMSQVIKKFIFIYFLILSSFAWAKNDLDKKLPSYQIFLDAQFACSNKPIAPYKFVRRSDNEPFAEVATKIWGVVKNSTLEELPSDSNKSGPRRKFKWTYKKMGLFRCGQKVYELSKQGIPMLDLPVVINAFKKPGYFDLSSDMPDEQTELNGDPYLYSFVRDADNDQPAPEGKVGMPCMVRFEDVLKDKNIINLNMLCKNESKKNIELTKKEIEAAIQFWKK